MVQRSEKKSQKALDQEGLGSVYDFLYHDARRVGSFLAQLNPSGHLQSLKKTSSNKESTSSKSALDSKLGVGIAGIAGLAEDSAGEENFRSSDATYDPLWANALELLDLLDSRGLLMRNAHEAGVGQFVVTTGELKVVNTSLLQSAWASPGLLNKALELDGTSDDLGKQLGMQVIRDLPTNPQAYHYGRDSEGNSIGASWMTLDPNNLILPIFDLTLKYGLHLGQWSLLGIKDAAGDGGAVEDDELVALMSGDWMKAAHDRVSTPLALFAELMAPAARRLIGRPRAYYGITPILIFREVAMVPPVQGDASAD